MRRIVPTTDTATIKETIKDVYDKLVYDDSPALEQYTPKGIWFILYLNEDMAGFIQLEPMNNVTWLTHIYLHKKYRGRDSAEWGQMAAQYMRQKFGAKKFIALTPYENARKYAEKIGFKYLTTLTASVRKNGQLLDQHLMEMN